MEVVYSFSNQKRIFLDNEVSWHELSSHISAVRAFGVTDRRAQPMGSVAWKRRPMGAQWEGLLSSRKRLVTGQAGK